METAIELFQADGKPSGVWYCSECRTVYTDHRKAEACHGVKYCEICAKEIANRTPYYRTLCDECSNKAWREEQSKSEFVRYTKAVKIKASEYTGPQVFFDNRYYETVEDVIDQCDEPPEYVWAAKDVGLRKATMEDLVERVLEEAWEDADIDDLHGVEELQKAIDAFNEANAGLSVYMVDYNEALVLDDEILAEWRAKSSKSRPTGASPAPQRQQE